MSVLQSIEAAAKPWATLYSDSRPISIAVMFVHLGGLLFAGGLAVSSDRATFRASRGDDAERTRLLKELGSSHAWIVAGLGAIFVSGIALALSDVKTFGYSVIYWVKMSLVVLLLLNGLVLQRTEQKLRTRSSSDMESSGRLWNRLRGTAAASMILWTAIVLAGVALVESS